jgi:hypothetical protein
MKKFFILLATAGIAATAAARAAAVWRRQRDARMARKIDQTALMRLEDEGGAPVAVAVTPR